MLVEVEGDVQAVERFFERLRSDAPPLARVAGVARRQIALERAKGFAILASERVGEPAASVSPDLATCADCLAELFDPRDRRFRYPFINCTNCGPRFTIVRDVPYDRPSTTHGRVRVCGLCEAEFDEPA